MIPQKIAGSYLFSYLVSAGDRADDLEANGEKDETADNAHLIL